MEISDSKVFSHSDLSSKAHQPLLQNAGLLVALIKNIGFSKGTKEQSKLNVIIAVIGNVSKT